MFRPELLAIFGDLLWHAAYVSTYLLEFS